MRRLIIFCALLCLSTLSALGAPQNSSGCPGSALGAFTTASNVGATFSTAGSTTTYTFISLTNENPVKGVPGLVKYCVYPDPASAPTGVTVAAKGANGDQWISKLDPKDFAFVRPGGDKTDIPLDGNSTLMGTATWTTVPTNQTILLHIYDVNECHRLYGSTSPNTCFVKPSPSLCSVGEGSTVAAYNAIPLGGVNCSPPSVSFEGDGINEFGDRVTLVAGTGRQLVSLKVLFVSWGCQSGSWWNGACSTAPNATFSLPITANIYRSSDCGIGTNDIWNTLGGVPITCQGTPFASVTQTQAVPYRPSADNTNCTGTDAGKWFNPDNGPTGKCQNGIGTLLTFNFPEGKFTLPDDVVWTVEYNTSHSGYSPIATPLGPGDATCPSGGCGYDSLNVGVMSYDNAPYAGADVPYPDTTVSDNMVFVSWYSGDGCPTNYKPPFDPTGFLQPGAGIESTTVIPWDLKCGENPVPPPTTPWTGYRPLGEIITK